MTHPARNIIELDCPDITLEAKTVFGIEFKSSLPAFSHKSVFVPDIDPDYHFDPVTTKAILAGFVYNKRVLVHGLHGTGKSTHIEQVAARLNWGCIRINLDGHIHRSDLIGRDGIVIKNSLQVTEFKEGILPKTLQKPYALVLDEYDAGRPEVMFVIQRLLEENGKLTLSEKGDVLRPHPFFRIFATANTVGTGDATGLYHGTQYINQGQMDRWSLTAELGYMPAEKEASLLLAKNPSMHNHEGHETIRAMVNLAGMIRIAFKADEIMTTISPRTLLAWAENITIFDDIHLAFAFSFLNRSDDADKAKIKEFYQRCFGELL